jgi:HPt (histidine-containing phosphotransfer) domain-containing protein
MTAHALTGDREKSLDAGLDDHITKPIDPELLFTTLGRWIGGKRKNGHTGIERNRTSGAVNEGLQGQGKPLDTNTGLIRLTNERLYRKMLSKFSEGYARYDQEISKALERQDVDTAYMLAHSIKGVSGTLGADRLYRSSIELEGAIRRREDRLPVLVQEFSQALGEVISFIRGMDLHDRAPVEAVTADAASVDPPEIRLLMEELLELLEDDLAEARMRFDRLQGLASLSGYADPLKEIEAGFSRYDTECIKKGVFGLADCLNIKLGGTHGQTEDSDSRRCD